MSFTTTVNHAQRRVFVRAEGPITLADIRPHLEEERLKVGLNYRELIDARGFSPAFSPEEVHTLVNILRRLGKDSNSVRPQSSSILISGTECFGYSKYSSRTFVLFGHSANRRKLRNGSPSSTRRLLNCCANPEVLISCNDPPIPEIR